MPRKPRPPPASQVPAEAATEPSLPELSIPSRAEVSTWFSDPFHLAIVVGVLVFLLLLVAGLIVRRRPPKVVDVRHAARAVA